MISVRGDAVIIEYDCPTMDAALGNDPRKSQVNVYVPQARSTKEFIRHAIVVPIQDPSWIILGLNARAIGLNLAGV